MEKKIKERQKPLFALKKGSIINNIGSISRNPVYTTDGPMNSAPEVTGKLFGQVWGIKANSGNGQGYNAWGNHGTCCTRII